MSTPDVDALRSQLDAVAADPALDPADRIASLRRLSDSIASSIDVLRSGLTDDLDLIDQLTTLLGKAASYTGDNELRRESGAMDRAMSMVRLRENADIRDRMVAQGMAPSEVNAAGFMSHDDLDQAQDDGTIEEAAFGVALNPALARKLALKRRRAPGGQFADEFHKAVETAKGRGGKKMIGGGYHPGEAPKVELPKPPGAPVTPPKVELPGDQEWNDVGGDVNKAADLLAQGQRVRLNQKSEASMLLSELAARVQEAKAKGDAAPNFDLCKVTVKNTNLFCAESKGIPRIKMPQLGGAPLPGSKADSMPKSEKGNVDLSEAFKEHLSGLGHGIEDTEVPSANLKASQIELNGGKVAGMVKALEAGKTLGGPDDRIFTSADDYIVDGHHRWAAQVGHELGGGGGAEGMKTKVSKVDMGIIELLDEANKFAKDMGIPQAGVTEGNDPNAPTPGERAQLEAGELPEHGSLYFNTDQADITKKYGEGVKVDEVPLDKIEPIRARPEGIANAKPLMAKAGLGEGGKRDPITLVKQGDGSYKVFDGNSTFANAQAAGWSKVPAMVVDSDEKAAEIEKTMKEAKAAAKAQKAAGGAPDASAGTPDAPAAPAADPATKPKPPQSPGVLGMGSVPKQRMDDVDSKLRMIFTPEESEEPVQDFADLDSLYLQAEADNNLFKDLMGGVRDALGGDDLKYDDLTSRTDPSTDKFLTMMGPLKKREAAEGKLIRKYDGDHNKLQDLVRATVFVNNLDDLPTAFDKIREVAAQNGWSVKGAQNKFLDGPPPPDAIGPTSAGYRDAKVALVSPNGIVTELQVNTLAMGIAKEGMGHKLYEQERDIEKQIKSGEISGDAAVAAAKKRIEKLRDQSKKLYQKSWEQSYGSPKS